MAKKQRKHERPAMQAEETKNGLNSLKDMLNADALGKLKLLEKEMKADSERKAQELAEQKRREQEERERNKSFGELLADYEKKGGGKFS
ncbi:hypothetical protein BRE01_15330 [Brevibacillus reuszeri]|uniref:DUF3886 domain-containing protein n=1 Tax=Brevibacillus reuszeri TaxID=54915 RepID=A0A0K9Z0Q7_9BACL|nr:DUF3886 domain-containing protein [Brevibacillus reuszeri]KNB74539.1 hypothetical protein ADS79_02310 [Brevibacillus reuszeri]MED1856471.1 DUF3886 domain-containing protein [Brevibacillus reuszeri]GED67831.1 hypothetical protein BRE01_15330 [Brevibacillus reuszeri]